MQRYALFLNHARVFGKNFQISRIFPLLLTDVKDVYDIHIIIYYIDGGEMEREGREGGDGTAEDAGEDYGLAGGQHTEEWIWKGHGAGMAGEKAINETVKTKSLLCNH